MPVIESRIDTSSSAFLQNRGEMFAVIERFRQLEITPRSLSESQKEKFRTRGQLLPRERLSMLLDRGSPVLELSSLAGFAMHDDNGQDQILAGCVITGIGTIAGVDCVFNVSDSAIKGGSIPPMGMKKTIRAQEIALQNKLPFINLIESGGANLSYQSEVFLEGGQVFYNMARLSAAGIPQITVCHGSSTAGGAYIPGMSDYLIMVKDRAKVFLAGPPLLKAATGEIADDESLGGALMHSEISGVSEYLAQDDADAIQIARDLIAKLDWQKQNRSKTEKPIYKPPRYEIEEICGLVPVDYRIPYDCRELIARLVDDSDFLEFKALFGPSTVCGYAKITGQASAIIANNGPIDEAGAAKAGQFIQLCCQSQTPIIFLQNTTGFMVGTQSERSGIVKHGAKMIQAVANAGVAKITLQVGASFGAGNYGMCGRSFNPRFVFSWPQSRLAVMGGEQAATVMRIIQEEKAKSTGKIPDDAKLAVISNKIIEQINKESDALFASARIWDDGIIDPRDSRKLLAFLLGICANSEKTNLVSNSFGIARF